MRESITSETKGITRIATIPPCECVSFCRTWLLVVPEWAVAIAATTLEKFPGELDIYVANEAINWEHYRSTGEFVPARSFPQHYDPNTLRQTPEK